MIDDLSRTLRAILTDPAEEAAARRGRLPAELASTQIVFDHPSEQFNPQQTTVDLFLYDIREDVELRSTAPMVKRTDGRVTTYPPPSRVACSYLVTAWPVGGPDLALQEHQLLSQVLQVFSRLPTIPDLFLQGALKGQKPPPPMVTALVDPQTSLSEFWTALGSRLRPSLTITATLAMEVAEPESEAMVVSEELRFSSHAALPQQTKPGSKLENPPKVERFVRIGGQVTDAAEEPVENATVAVVELGRETRTNKDGRFILDRVTPGDLTLRVTKDTEKRDLSISVPAGEGLPVEGRGSRYDVRLG